MWIEKYRPADMDSLISHKDIIATRTYILSSPCEHSQSISVCLSVRRCGGWRNAVELTGVNIQRYLTKIYLSPPSLSPSFF